MMSGKDIHIYTLLTPIAFLYGVGVRLRNRLFDWGVLPSVSFTLPVICVGNLAVGGTGKTPHIEYLLRLLLPRYRVAVISRGYKRKTRGFFLADTHSTAADIGDEPFQIKQKFPEVMLAVDGDRRRAIRTLQALPEQERPDVILMDDGFQHRYVKPSMSILLTDFHRLYFKDKLLPAGRLREPKGAVRRADAVIVTKSDPEITSLVCQEIEDRIDRGRSGEALYSYMSYEELQPLFPERASERKRKEMGGVEEMMLISGIANPAPFKREMQQYASRLVSFDFPDHHDFTAEDFQRMEQQFNALSTENKMIVVTEKDAARLREHPLLPSDWKPYLYLQPISIRFIAQGEKAFHKLIINHIEKFKTNT